MMKKRLLIFLASAKHQARSPILLAVVAVTLIIAAVNITTMIDDFANAGRILDWRQPVLTELSSAAVLIVLLPFTFAFFEAAPLRPARWLNRVPIYLAASILFSALHVSGMVLIRKFFWGPLFGGPYEFFGDLIGTSLYEYRKDFATFLLFMVVFHLQKQVLEARKAAQTLGAGARKAEPIALKSGATTILLQPAEFLYAKSAGNYAEITSLSGTQLARVTLKELTDQLTAAGSNAARIHRSYIVNRAAIMETSPIAGGDLKIKLRGGETLRASRRYRDGLEL